MSCLKILPVKADQLSALGAFANADNHCVLYPTHLVTDAGSTIGYASVLATPIVNVWLDSKRVSALVSARLLGMLDQALRFSGQRGYVMPCSKDSPFFPHMGRLGFSVMGENVWHFKDLTKD